VGVTESWVAVSLGVICGAEFLLTVPTGGALVVQAAKKNKNKAINIVVLSIMNPLYLHFAPSKGIKES